MPDAFSVYKNDIVLNSVYCLRHAHIARVECVPVANNRYAIGYIKCNTRLCFMGHSDDGSVLVTNDPRETVTIFSVSIILAYILTAKPPGYS